jgi:hypothetical protein
LAAKCGLAAAALCNLHLEEAPFEGHVYIDTERLARRWNPAKNAHHAVLGVFADKDGLKQDG